MNTELLETLLEESFETISKIEHNPHHVPRQLLFPQSQNMIKVAIGMRRTGKTYFLYQEG